MKCLKDVMQGYGCDAIGTENTAQKYSEGGSRSFNLGLRYHLSSVSFLDGLSYGECA